VIGTNVALLPAALAGVGLLTALWALLSRPGGAAAGAAEQQPDGDGAAGRHLPIAAYRAVVEGDDAFISHVTPELEALLGYTRQELVSDRSVWLSIVHEDDRERVQAERTHHVTSGQRLRSEYRVRPRHQETVWVRDEAIVVATDGGRVRFQHGVLIDITERKSAEEALAHHVLHDSLTGLPNRALFMDRLEQSVRAARRSGATVALLVMDLDRFKEINEAFGHRYGDEVLRRIVDGLRGVLRESDTVARLGGDEFGMLLPAVDVRGAALAAQKIAHVLRTPFEVAGQIFEVGASIGIALSPAHGDDADSVLQRAEVAMYAAKRGQTDFALYEPEQDPHTPDRFALVSELRLAIDGEQLVLHYQPQAELHTGSADHLEALVRWNHPDRGVLRPDSFLGLAEHAGLIRPLTMWVIEAALRQCHVWRSSGLEVSVAVNLSPRILHDPRLVPAIEGLLAKWGTPAACLEVEITEGALMEDPSRAMETLTRLHEMGVTISIDDFGTGYSSLGYLTRLPASQIKIDKSFVQDMVTNRDSAFIVRSVIDLGHNLNMEVVAEGVENQDTWDLLTEMGCDVVQGFHLSKPLPASDVPRWMATAGARLACVT